MSKRKLNNIYYNEPWNANFPKRSSHLTGNALKTRLKKIKSIPIENIQRIARSERLDKKTKNLLQTILFDESYNGDLNFNQYQNLFHSYLKKTNSTMKENIKKLKTRSGPYKTDKELINYYRSNFKRFLRTVNNNNEGTNEIPISGGRKKTKSKRKIHKGPRGGKYYIKNGKKVYIRK